jgi:hypothetical protein
LSIDAHKGGGIKVYPPSEIFSKLVNKNAIKHRKGVPSPKNLAKTSSTLPLEFQTIYDSEQLLNFFAIS